MQAWIGFGEGDMEKSVAGIGFGEGVVEKSVAGIAFQELHWSPRRETAKVTGPPRQEQNLWKT